MASKFPLTLTLGIDADLEARLAQASLVTGLPKAEVARQWLRLGRVADLVRPGTGLAHGPRADRPPAGGHPHA